MSTRILGLSFAYHDSAAALLVDGQLIAAASEERFSRRKHTSAFPQLAIQYCLETAGLTPKDLTHVVFYEKPFVKLDRILTTYVSTWPRSYKAFAKALPVWMRDKLWIKQEIADHLQTDAEILFCEHHLSHAASAFLCSPFERAAVLTLDGVGEWETATCGIGEGNQIRLERHIDYPHSLGLFYSALTAYLGFRVNDAEWKVMGLAPYGEPRYVDAFRELIDIAADGSFALDMRYYAHHLSESSMLMDLFETHMGQPKRSPNAELTQFHKDIARSGQAIVEEAMVKIGRDLHQRYGVDKIVIGGGVGLNSVGNFRILEQTPFTDIFIQPAAGDDGAAIGAALYIYHCVLGHPRQFQMKHAYFGPEFDDVAIETTLRSLGCQYEKLTEDALIEKTAQLLVDGQVLGWFQGRMEFGPRALGNRSIIADPRNVAMKDIINAKVKYREWFRPFAPSVAKESAGIYFDLDVDSPFMLLVPKVRDAWRDKLPAITHEDGTGRVQTVEAEINPRYYKLIKQFGKLSGVDVVLNTSFNVRGEPVVCTPEDAIRCYEKTGIDYLVMGNFIVSQKRAQQSYSMEEINELDVVPEAKVQHRDTGGIASQIGTLVIALAVIFGVLEVGVRALELVRFGDISGQSLEPPSIYQDHPRLGHILVPGSHLETHAPAREADVRINALGLRGPETVLHKPAGRLRVACLGGSTTFGTGEKDDAHTWPRVLEAKLRASLTGKDSALAGQDLEVLNFGVPGYDAADNLDQLMLQVAAMQPDVVLLFQGYNDLATLTLPEGHGTYLASHQPPPPRGWLADHSLLVRRFQTWRNGRKQREQLADSSHRKDTLPEQAPKSWQQTVQLFVGGVRAMGARPVVVTQVAPFAPEGGQKQLGDDQKLLETALQFRPYLTPKGLRDGMRNFNALARDVAQQQQATLIDAAKILMYSSEDFVDDVHFSDAGSAHFAEAIAPAVAAELKAAK